MTTSTRIPRGLVEGQVSSLAIGQPRLDEFVNGED
jgi:hypothetical protein